MNWQARGCAFRVTAFFMQGLGKVEVSAGRYDYSLVNFEENNVKFHRTIYVLFNGIQRP